MRPLAANFIFDMSYVVSSSESVHLHLHQQQQHLHLHLQVNQKLIVGENKEWVLFNCVMCVLKNGRNKILFRACLPRMDSHKLILFLEFFKNHLFLVWLDGLAHLTSCVIDRRSYMCSYC